ncbi:hypothetical protein PRK78_004943 [Emydomyces testavorans]|uniref:FAD dependent oxidoreductase domain-containing protein n=1 Tax=Emydomyces testavorans TaxID=2070801 RepID=A0AAF0DIL8_9EURO|nr:hypothetical protein PRK78_004943 [Emydomyces testavorans]
MSTVIVGGGIIGVSIAYYLSDPQRWPRPKEIHIVDSSAELFASASGYAAGFLARDWFSPEVAPLGELSFCLHRQLAKDNQGDENWGYMSSTAVRLQVDGADGKRSKRGDDWLRRGASRAEAAVREETVIDKSNSYPLWLTKQGGTVERISNKGSAAQMGVQIHYPARPVALSKKDASAGTGEVVLQRLDVNRKLSISCGKLILAAGAWTPQVFATLFPKSGTKIPIGALSGYSLVFRSPRHTLDHERETYAGGTHAVFTTHPKSCGFSPEIFSRRGAEIYIAGLNSLEIPLPEVATDSLKIMKKEESNRVRRVAVALMGQTSPHSSANLEEVIENIDDLEVVREALCFRPYTDNGRPIIGKIENQLLGSGEEFQGGVFIATGHGPWGISLSLGTGKVVADMVAGSKLSADVSRLGLEAENGRIRGRL